ncbi:acetolactate synthase small subunit [Sutcliffiella horikoshii]|uniref:acetolactate synthase small subunit n=1 Tax=Bacillaceae TaxID=186817 RepID=UPI00069EEFD1|nr:MULTISPECIES: acetolactate synthase small subunit [Bacillaceae]MCM3616520.1 acetolactate synthase small subunit [Sutcliffiella horikoshii]
MKRTLSLLVNNQLGVLNRLTNLFLRKGLNIESLAVAPVNESPISLMTIVVNVVEEQEVEKIKLQLDKQIDVIQITDISEQIALTN